MVKPILLASSSEIRQRLLQQAGVSFQAIPARIDEETIRKALLAEGATPHDLADALAEFKARKISEKHPQAIVIGSDQILSLKGTIGTKPEDPDQARAQLMQMRAKTHDLYSGVVVYDQGRPVWRHVGYARMTMHDLSDGFIDTYIQRNWHSVRHSVGCYKLEEEGARLFAKIDGDYFTVLGLPLIELLSYLTRTGALDI